MAKPPTHRWMLCFAVGFLLLAFACWLEPAECQEGQVWPTPEPEQPQAPTKSGERVR